MQYVTNVYNLFIIHILYIIIYSVLYSSLFTDTSSVQRVEAVLSLDVLHVTCYLAEYSVDIGCFVEVLYKNEIIANKTIVRTKNETQLTGFIKLNLPDFNSTHSDLVVMAFDYNIDGSIGQLGFNVTPSLAPPTMTTKGIIDRILAIMYNYNYKCIY